MNILITGASTGIGFDTALHLSGLGHTIFAVARRRNHLENLNSVALKNNSDARIHLLIGDLTDLHFLNEIAHVVTGQKGQLDILINNAGMLINKPFEHLTSEDWQKVYATNVFAAVDLTRKLLPLFSPSGPGHIVNISSMGGFQGSAKFKGLSAYSSSKAALVGITECLAEEFKDRNIAVNCICLGSVKTEMFSAAFPDFTAATTSMDAAKFISEFALNGAKLFNGKIIPVSSSTP